MVMNRLVIRDLIGVVLAIAAITTIALLVSHRTPLPSGEEPVPEVALGRSPEATPCHGSERCGLPVAALGARLYVQKGCVACHSVDGSPRIGPSFLHDYGSTVALSRGGAVAMDDAYIRESLLSPRAKARPGFPDSMPSFEGLLRERELDALTAYLRSLR